MASEASVPFGPSEPSASFVASVGNTVDNTEHMHLLELQDLQHLNFRVHSK